jgi:hypothetical protein
LTVAGVPVNAPFAAVRDGDGDWQMATGTAGVYSFPVASGRYAIAYICPPPSVGATARRVHLLVYGVEDGTTVAEQCGTSAAPANDAVYSVTVTGPLSPGAWVAVGETSMGPVSAGGNALFEIPSGVYDTLVGGLNDDDSHIDRVTISRAHVVPAGDSYEAYDYTAGTATAHHALVFGNLLVTETPFVEDHFLSDGGTDLDLDRDRLVGPFPTVAESQLQGNDIHDLRFGADDASAGTQRVVRLLARTPGDQGVTLPPVLSVVAGVQSTASNLVLDFDVDLADATFVAGDISQTTPSGKRGFIMIATPAGLGATGSTRIETPDLSTVPTWDPDWQIQSGLSLAWALTSVSSNRSALETHDIVTHPPQAGLDGLQVLRSQVSGSMTP